MAVDSRQRKLNYGQIITMFLAANPQPHPPQVMMAGILRELSMPQVKTIQFGNTVFEVIPGKDRVAFFKAFNADTAPNFVENGRQFVVWARHEMGLKKLVTQFQDPSLLQIFKIGRAHV